MFYCSFTSFPFFDLDTISWESKNPTCYYRAYFVLTVSVWANSITSMEALLLMVHHSSYICAHCIIIYILKKRFYISSRRAKLFLLETNKTLSEDQAGRGRVWCGTVDQLQSDLPPLTLQHEGGRHRCGCFLW